MKRLTITLILIGILYIIGQHVFDGMESFRGVASVSVSSEEREYMLEETKKYFATLTDAFIPDDVTLTLERSHIDTDHTEDYIAHIEDPSTCGSGGCLTALFISEANTERLVPFGYAVHSIEVLESITGGMHDIMVNGSQGSTFVWNGERYIVEAQ